MFTYASIFIGSLFIYFSTFSILHLTEVEIEGASIIIFTYWSTEKWAQLSGWCGKQSTSNSKERVPTYRTHCQRCSKTYPGLNRPYLGHNIQNIPLSDSRRVELKPLIMEKSRTWQKQEIYEDHMVGDRTNHQGPDLVIHSKDIFRLYTATWGPNSKQERCSPCFVEPIPASRCQKQDSWGLQYEGLELCFGFSFCFGLETVVYLMPR